MKDLLDPDEVRDVLAKRFYSTDPPSRKQKRKAPKPEHYEVICISLYKEDLARLDAAVEALKKKGHRKMSRSALIRFALDTMDVGALPRSY